MNITLKLAQSMVGPGFELSEQSDDVFVVKDRGGSIIGAIGFDAEGQVVWKSKFGMTFGKLTKLIEYDLSDPDIKLENLFRSEAIAARASMIKHFAPPDGYQIRQ